MEKDKTSRITNFANVLLDALVMVLDLHRQNTIQQQKSQVLVRRVAHGEMELDMELLHMHQVMLVLQHIS